MTRRPDDPALNGSHDAGQGSRRTGSTIARARDHERSGPDVVAVGETMAMVTPTDLVPLEDAEHLSLRIGGAESNLASWLAGLGFHASWHSRVGDDPLGRRILRELRGRGVDVGRAIVDADARTGVYFKDPCPDSRRVLYYRDGSAASRMGPDSLDAGQLAGARIVHFSGITAALSASCRALAEALVAQPPPGSLVSFDVNYRPTLWSADEAAPVLAGLADASDLLFVGLDEAKTLWGCETPVEVRERFTSPARILVKDGPVGAYLMTPRGTTFVPALDVDASEPIGAGDAFAAGYLAGTLDDLAEQARLRFGHLLAASVLRVTDDYVAAPPRSWIDRQLELTDEEWRRLEPYSAPSSARSAPGTV